MPVLDMAYDSTGLLLATCSTDRTVRVWNADKAFCTHSFKGHNAMVSRVAWHPDINRLELVSCADSGEIRVWNLRTGECVATLTSHVGLASAVAFVDGGNTMITSGRDKVINIWDITLRNATTSGSGSSGKSKAAIGYRHLRTVPAYETLESISALPPLALAELLTAAKRNGTLVATAGEHGQIRVWNYRAAAATNGQPTLECVHTHALPQTRAAAPGGASATVDSKSAAPSTESIGITRLLMAPGAATGVGGDMDDDGLSGSGSASVPVGAAARLIAVTSDHNFYISSLDTLRKEKLLLGFNDEIYDIKPLPTAPASTASASASASTPASFSSSAGRHVVMATNSAQVRVLNLDTSAAELLTGHRHIVLTVDVSADGQWIVTGSKDHTVRVWRTPVRSPGDSKGSSADADTSSTANTCVALAEGHSDAVGAVRFSRASPSANAFWVVSASADRTIKLWDTASLLALATTGTAAAAAAPASLSPVLTKLAHEKDINCLAVAPNDKLIACGSQDKTITLWSIVPTASDAAGSAAAAASAVASSGSAGVGASKASKRAARLGLTAVTTLRGHKRGVWCVEFSPVDKVLASCSGDKTIKIWSVATHQCLRTLEGHTNTVLRVVFLRNGIQLLSAGADSVVKLWNLKTNECVNTFDAAHTEKIWAMALLEGPASASSSSGSNKGDSKTAIATVDGALVTGGADSVLAVWSDVTSSEQQAAIAESARNVLTEQKLMNCLNRSEFGTAVQLALSLRQPRRLLTVFQRLIAKQQTPQNATAAKPVSLKATVAALSLTDLAQCLEYVREWNTNAKFCHTAHAVLHAIMSSFAPEALKKVPTINELLPSLLVYSERHFQRLEKLQQKSHLIDYM